MQNIIMFILGTVAGMLLSRYGNPFAKINDQRHQEKEVAKEKIVSYINTHGEVTAEQLMDVFSISKTTLHSYIDELQDANTVRQVGSHHEPRYQMVK